MNTELLLKVRDAILAEPLKFDMSLWVQPDNQSPCGTSACIAGHAVAIGMGLKTLNKVFEYSDVQSEAASKLEITAAQEYQLFYATNWPFKFWDDYADASEDGNRTEMAKVAAARIDHFIATGE